MATVPGILLIGDYPIQGVGIGEVGLNAVCDSLLGTRLSDLCDRKVMRITPDDPSTGAPTAASLSFWPWFDALASDTDYTVASSSTTTATVSPSPGWTVNQWALRAATFRNTFPIPGVGFAQRVQVLSNTADTITFAPTTAPTVGGTFFLGEGRFDDYHPAAGFLVLSEIGVPSFRGGSSYQNFGNGVGPDATLVRELWEHVYDEAPYFHLWKYADTGTVNTGWADAPNDASRAAMLAMKTRVDAAATARGNTIAWEFAVIDFSTRDIDSASGTPTFVLTYEARLREMIAWLKGGAVLNNSSLGIILVSHRGDFFGTSSAGAAPFMRAAHRNIAADTPHVAIVDLEGVEIGNGAGDLPSDEVTMISQAATLEYGREIRRAIQRLQLGTPDTPAGGLPTYLLFGDSITTGPATAAWVAASASPAISGPNPPSLVRPSNQLIWNSGTGVLEVYEPGANSNTSGSVTATSGPDLSVMAALGELHPDGFALIKRGASGSGLAVSLGVYSGGEGGRWSKAADEHYPELQALFAACCQYVNETMSKQVDLRGAFISLGHNDHVVADGGEAFADELPGFYDDLQRDFGTRTNGDEFPVIWRRPQDDAAGVVPAQMRLVREALQRQQRRKTGLRFIDVDDLERDRTDNLHETPDSAVEHGYRLVRKLQKGVAI